MPKPKESGYTEIGDASDARIHALKKGIIKMIHPNATDVRNNKLITSLLDEIVRKNESMLVLVFTRNRKEVEILQLPKVLAENERDDLCTSETATFNDPSILLSIVSTKLKNQDRSSTDMSGVLSNVIVIEPNPNYHRSDSNLIVGYWHTHQATTFPIGATYDGLIRNAQKKLNSRAPGK